MVAKGTKTTQPFQSRRQSSVLCWLLQLRKIPIYADSWFCVCFFFFPSFSCNWTRKQQDAHLQQGHGHELQRYAAKSTGISWPFRAAVTGARSRGQEIAQMLFHLSPLGLPLPISTGAKPGTETCSPLRNITYTKRKEKWKRSPSCGVRAIYKRARARKGGSP